MYLYFFFGVLYYEYQEVIEDEKYVFNQLFSKRN